MSGLLKQIIDAQDRQIKDLNVLLDSLRADNRRLHNENAELRVERDSWRLEAGR